MNDKCERCGTSKSTKRYRPNMGKHPKKIVSLCDECAAKDPDAILIKVGRPANPVSTMEPPSRTDENVVETLEFDSPTQEQSGPPLPPLQSEGPPIDRKALMAELEKRKTAAANIRQELAKIERNRAQLQIQLVGQNGAIAQIVELLK